MTTTILDAALELTAAGYSVLPVKADGSKAPATAEWKTFMHTIPTPGQLHAWFDQGNAGLGIVQGAISGRAELTEVEGRAADRLPELRQLAHDTGIGALWDSIVQGWSEQSPSGGYHFHYRLADGVVPGNVKIARRPSTPDELTAWVAIETTKAHDLAPTFQVKRLEKLATMTGAQVPQVLAETRGEGGQVVAAPTPGTHHKTGLPWVRVIGGPTTAATITLEERGMFHAVLASLDEMPAPVAVAYVQGPGAAVREPGEGITPGDDYEAKTTWAEILVPEGWALDRTVGTTSYWVRPGKQRGDGISATTGHADDRDRLYVFTSSTDFAQETPYTKFGAYAVLHHGGDHTAAATRLGADGYGQRAEQVRRVHDSFFDDILTAAPAWPATVPTTTGTTDPQAVTAAPSGGTPPPPAVTPGPFTVAEPSTYTETDDGNALRLIDTHGAHIRYCPQRGSWLTWDGHRWRWDIAGLVNELARDVARDLPDGDKLEHKHRLSSLSKRGIEAMGALARTDQRAVVHLTNLDALPYELNTPTGAINLRTGQLHAPDPRALHTRSTNVAPDFTTTPTRWLAFLADTFAGDPALTTYVQRLMGVSLAGIVLEQLLPFAFGAGKNGKSTFFEVVQDLIGIGDDGYSISVPADMLVARRNDDHPATIAQLSGARVAIGSEIEAGSQFAEAKVKMLTGGDPINARFMNKNPFTFTPTHSLWLHANYQPEVRTGGPAFWRRLRLVPFEHAVEESKRVKNLRELLVRDEGPAILAWLIRGAADYFTSGLAEPASVLAATEAYQGDQDTVGRFVAECCETGSPNAQHMNVKTSDLRQAYETWCRVEGEQPVAAKSLGLQLRARFGVEANRDMKARFYSGIRLVDVSLDDTEPPSTDATWQQGEGW